MEDTSLMTGTDASAELIWKNTCSPTRFVYVTVKENMDVVCQQTWLCSAEKEQASPQALYGSQM